MKKVVFILPVLWLGLVLAADPGNVEKVFEELSNDPAAGQTFTITQDDLNAFVKAELKRQPNPALQSIDVKMNEGSFTTELKVDMDEVKLEDDSMTATLFKALLRGTQVIKIEGKLVAQNGVGTYSTERAWVNDIPVPATLVDSLLSNLGQRFEPPFDPTRPFGMPYSIKSLRFVPGKVLLKT